MLRMFGVHATEAASTNKGMTSERATTKLGIMLSRVRSQMNEVRDARPGNQIERLLQTRR